MDDTQDYEYKKNKFYKGHDFLHRVNKFQKALKCSAYVKVLRNDELEVITPHNKTCMMER